MKPNPTQKIILQKMEIFRKKKTFPSFSDGQKEFFASLKYEPIST